MSGLWIIDFDLCMKILYSMLPRTYLAYGPYGHSL